jgi:hypothetical protein
MLILTTDNVWVNNLLCLINFVISHRIESTKECAVSIRTGKMKRQSFEKIKSGRFLKKLLKQNGNT